MLLAVFDGHGKHGAEASSFVQHHIKDMFIENPNDFFKRNKLSRIVEKTHEALISEVNWKLSGTTAWIWVVNEKKVFCANVGDSRAVLFSKDFSNQWVTSQLSFDHKIDRIEEVSRITNSGGRIHQYINSNGAYFGPYRVWKQDEDTPGLAMSRSCGDTIAHKIGVISTPGK